MVSDFIQRKEDQTVRLASWETYRFRQYSRSAAVCREPSFHWAVPLSAVFRLGYGSSGSPLFGSGAAPQGSREVPPRRPIHEPENRSRSEAQTQNLAPFQRKRARHNRGCDGHGAATGGLAVASRGGSRGRGRGCRCRCRRGRSFLAAASGANMLFLTAEAAHGAQQQGAAG